MRKKNTLVQGVGINDYIGSITDESGKDIRSYVTWIHMVERCYNTTFQVKHPTYIGCTVAPEWLYFSNFKEWYDANYIEGFQLDKDILVEGNKIYSPESCRFVPRHINNLLNDHGNARGDLPQGVSITKSIANGIIYFYYRGQCNNGRGKLLSKAFKTLEEAVAWYSATKTRVVREVATRALLAGEIQQDVFDALVARKF